MDVEELIRDLPKAEQHIHIVGSTRPTTLLWLVDEGGLEAPFGSVEEVEDYFSYSDFPHFIRVYSTVADSITEEGQFERLIYEMLEDEARCNVMYVEASFSAPDHTRRVLDYGAMLDAINKGIRRARRNLGVECSIRIDLVRNYGPDVGMEVLNLIEGNGENIVSIDIGGSEESFPPGPYADVYKRARDMGLHTVAHAGEAAGPESVLEAITRLDVEHVGHGISASGDSRLEDLIRERGITVESCPVSNLRTGVVRSLREHPVRRFYDGGMSVTVNSDDPSMFGTNMNNEYLQLHSHLGFTVRELFQLSLNAVDSAFLTLERRIELRDRFLKEYEDLLDEHEEP
jgi:adenosine deaminase